MSYLLIGTGYPWAAQERLMEEFFEKMWSLRVSNGNLGIAVPIGSKIEMW